MKKTLICIILTFATLFGMLIPTAAASSAITPEGAADRVIESRLAELETSFVGSYFTSTGNPCYSYYDSNSHHCGTCFTKNVINASWCKRKIANLSFGNDFTLSKLPHTFYGSNHNYYPNGYSCHSYSVIMFGLLFCDLATEGSIKAYDVGTYRLNRENMESYAQIGDYLRLDDRHSAIYLGCTNEGIVVLDSNSAAVGNNLVKKRTIPYTWYSYATMTRPTDRLKVHNCSSFHTDPSGQPGRCRECGKAFEYTTTSTYSGYYSRAWNSNKALQIKYLPYSDSLTMAYTGRDITVLGSATNSYGNTWIYVEFVSGNMCKTGWVYGNDFLNAYIKTSNLASVSTANNASTPAITSISIVKKANANAAHLYWSSNDAASHFSVEYQDRTGIFRKDGDYRSKTSRSYISSGLGSRDVVFRVTPFNKDGIAGLPAYVTYYK